MRDNLNDFKTLKQINMYNKQAFHGQCNPHHARAHRSFGGPFRRGEWKQHFSSNYNFPAANVMEMDDKYELHLIAPGYEKNDFLIAVIDNNLSVSVKKESFESEGNWRRKEYTPRNFVRQFQLNEKIDKSDIIAKYENGILILSLPKSAGFETKREEIKVE